MRKLLALLVACLCCLSLCCKPAAAPTEYVDSPTAAERAEAKSVAIVTLDQDGTYSPECGGVWVAQDRILTAFHCVATLGKPKVVDAVQQMLESMGADVPPELRTWVKPWDPTGQMAHYTDRAGYDAKPEIAYDAKVLACDPANDMALLVAMWPPHNHDVARLSERPIRDGDEVDIVGAPLGMAFSYAHGYVSSTRQKGWRDEKFKTLQISVPVFMGNSGGGAFDTHGDLIGISDFIKVYEEQVVPSTGFFQHRDVIKIFLDMNP